MDDEETNVDNQNVTEAPVSKRQRGRSGIIKNKLRRQLLYQKEKLRRAKERRERKAKRKREAEQLGEEVNSYLIT